MSSRAEWGLAAARPQVRLEEAAGACGALGGVRGGPQGTSKGDIM